METLRIILLNCARQKNGWLQMGIVCGVIWGMPMAIIFMIAYPEKDILRICTICAAGGFIFGILFWGFLRSLLR